MRSTKAYLSAIDACKLFGCSRVGLGRWIEQGRITHKFIMEGKRKVLRIQRKAFYAFMQAQRNNTRIGRIMVREPNRKPIISKGYRMIYKPEHPRAMHDGYVYEHWLVMEASIGRYLTRTETVHHINRIRHDNDINNLVLFASKSEHMKIAHGPELSAKLKSKSIK